MRILVVDDEPLVRRSLKKAAEMRGHEVKVAANGLEGKVEWELFDPQVVFVDVLMPVMDGPTLLAQKPGSSSAKIIMMSAFTGEYDSEVALKMGANLFMAKPFEDILEVINHAERLFNDK
jgi:two-component system, response regulator PdtaR